jgi:hypothetical protein
MDALSEFGFTWGPAEVERTATFERRRGKTWRVLRVYVRDHPSQELEIYISPTGRSVRVFRRGKELVAK